MTPEEQDREEQEAVRRALAAEPGPGPLPRDVAARLEATLADLVAERADDRDAGRRTARAPRGRALLVAAASVAVLGVGIGTVVQNQGLGGGDAETATSGAADTAADPRSDSNRTLQGQESAPELAEEPGNASLERSFVPAPSPVPLRTRTLRADVARLEGARTLTAQPAPDGVRPDEPAAPRDLGAARLLSACDLPSAGPGDRLVAVLLDGDRGTLVLREAPGSPGLVVAQVYACGDGDDLLAETRLTDR